MLTVCLVFLSVNALLAQNKYVGAAKCKMCHIAPDKGKQYTQWTESKHSKAFETLKSDKALAIAKVKGIVDPSKDAKCLKCHSTASSVDATLIESIKDDEGVSCESCHGPGSAYKAMNIMKNTELGLKNGLILPTEAVCVKCHNSESPTFVSFDFKTYSDRIKHPNPKNVKQ